MFIEGEKLGPYTFVRQLGGGHSGVVWLATKKGEECAIKIPVSPEIDKQAFLKEAELWKAAGVHTNIARLRDVQEYDGYVVLESSFYRDGSLQHWIDSRKKEGQRIHYRKAIQIMLGVLRGLAHLHSLDPPLIHRDVKPSNVLLTGLTPHITDFGIARLTDETWKTHSGTHLYMAPEAFKDERSEKTDVWSAGIMFYQLMDGRLPFGHVYEIVSDYPLPPLPPFIPSSIREVVIHALKKDSSERVSSAVEMIHMLDAALAEIREAQNYVIDAAEHYRNGNFNDASRLLDRAVAADPNYAPAYLYRGSLYCDKHEFGLATADLNKAIELNDTYQVAYTVRAEAYKRSNNYALAINDLTEAINIYPNDASAYFGRAIARREGRGEWPLSEDLGDIISQSGDDLEKAITIEPDSPLYQLEMSLLLKAFAIMLARESQERFDRAMQLSMEEVAESVALSYSELDEGVQAVVQQAQSVQQLIANDGEMNFKPTLIARWEMFLITAREFFRNNFFKST